MRDRLRPLSAKLMKYDVAMLVAVCNNLLIDREDDCLRCVVVPHMFLGVV